MSAIGEVQNIGASEPASRATRPFSAFEWMVALRYLRARRQTGFVSVIAGFSFAGIMLGVATLIVVMSVMNGFRHDLLQKIVGINGHIFVQGVGKPISDYNDLVTRVAKVPGVTIVLPMIEGAAGVSSQFNQSGALVRGVRGSDLARLPGISGHIVQGTIANFDTSGGVAIGERMAQQLSLQVGDRISVLTAKGDQTPFGVAPRIKAYPVVAIFKVGMSEFDSTFVYMPLHEAQAFFNREGEASVVEAFVSNPDDTAPIDAKIQATAGRPVIVTDWRERNKTFFDALNVERNVMFIILTLIVLVAALNIISGLTMLVKDKGADIAILRTIGATRWAIMRIFLINGAFIGVAGTVVGVLLGLLVASNLEHIRNALNRFFGMDLFPAQLYFLSKLPSEVRFSNVVEVVVLALSLSLLATFYPSWQAAKLDPVEALRYG